MCIFTKRNTVLSLYLFPWVRRSRPDHRRKSWLYRCKSGQVVRSASWGGCRPCTAPVCRPACAWPVGAPRTLAVQSPRLHEEPGRHCERCTSSLRSRSASTAPETGLWWVLHTHKHTHKDTHSMLKCFPAAPDDRLWMPGPNIAWQWVISSPCR